MEYDISNMKEYKTDQVNVKYPIGLLKKIDEDVEKSQEFRNRSEWIIAAARYYLEQRKKENP